MPGRKIRNEAEAQQCLDRVAASNLTRVDWARQQGIDARSLNAWRLILERRQAQDETQTDRLQLIELVPSAPPATSRPLTLRCGAWSIDVAADTDLVLLGKVLGVVEAC